MNTVERNYLRRISNRLKDITGQMLPDMVDYEVLNSIHKEPDTFIHISREEDN